MKAILFNKGVYVYTNSTAKLFETDDVKKYVIVTDSLYGYKNLYGGRVQISIRTGKFLIDGIFMLNFYTNGKHDSVIDGSKMVAYLNQIEQLGVDTFLANYKQSLAQTKDELCVLRDKLENELSIHEDEDKAKVLTQLREAITAIIFILLALMINMNAGIDNHVYVDAYDEIVNECVKK